MFKKSALLVALVLVSVTLPSFSSNYAFYQGLPSAYDPGISIEVAFKDATEKKRPVLIEFYTDSCGTCREVTPRLHKIYDTQLKDRTTLVMMDLANPDHADIAQLFGVETLPGIYVFDAAQMKKHHIPQEKLVTDSLLTQALLEVLPHN